MKAGFVSVSLTSHGSSFSLGVTPIYLFINRKLVCQNSHLVSICASWDISCICQMQSRCSHFDRFLPLKIHLEECVTNLPIVR